MKDMQDQDEKRRNKGWETDYEMIQRKFEEKVFDGMSEIVLRNHRDPRATPVDSRKRERRIRKVRDAKSGSTTRISSIRQAKTFAEEVTQPQRAVKQQNKTYAEAVTQPQRDEKKQNNISENRERVPPSTEGKDVLELEIEIENSDWLTGCYVGQTYEIEQPQSSKVVAAVPDPNAGLEGGRQSVPFPTQTHSAGAATRVPAVSAQHGFNSVELDSNAAGDGGRHAVPFSTEAHVETAATRIPDVSAQHGRSSVRFSDALDVVPDSNELDFTE
ncbi:hypothetical protein Ancab_013124, partial [Ancistrocladus abbreviatus]